MPDKNIPRDQQMRPVAKEGEAKMPANNKVMGQEKSASQNPTFDQNKTPSGDKPLATESSGSKTETPSPDKRAPETPSQPTDPGKQETPRKAFSPSPSESASASGSKFLPWGRLILLMTLISTWTLWLPFLSPDLTQRIRLVQPSDLDHLSAKITALEANYGDYKETALSSETTFKSAPPPPFQDSERLAKLEAIVADLIAASKASPSPLSPVSPQASEITAFTAYTETDPAFQDAQAFLKNAQQPLKEAQEAFDKSEQNLRKAEALLHASRLGTEYFLKAFATYEALETSVMLGEPFDDVLQRFSNLVGPNFDTEHLQSLASFAALGLPSRETLVEESRLLLALEQSRPTSTAASQTPTPQAQTDKGEPSEGLATEADSRADAWSFSHQVYSLLDRLTDQVKKMVTIRERVERPENPSTLERLKEVHTLFQKGAFKEGAQVLASIKGPSEKIQLLLQQTLAYHQSTHTLLALKKHLYSPVFLETLWGDQQNFQEAPS